mgnify:CR=1 FL=1
MMKYRLFFLLLLPLVLNAQPRGVKPLPENNAHFSSGNAKQSPSTYAVVIGISDYQDPGIPDLKYADKDAEAFAAYLRSDAGGKLDQDHLKVLINQQATMAQFANALDWLWEVSKEGDQAIIYFSGHGDVEKKSLTQPGFLLCWDAPARVYMAGGAFALPMLQEVVSTLSIQNKAKVIVITDACRSGILAGSSVGGAQATASNLAKQFANEIKIMSCQPNEYSIEGEQWGGGRGAFSYHLMDALYGLADQNKDLWVTLQEVGRYLEDHVSNEVAPVSQIPMIVGNRSEKLTPVSEKLLASVKSGKANQNKMLSSVDTRGIEDEVLAKADSNVKKIYVLFKKALKEKQLMEPKNECAEYYYQILSQEPAVERLHSTLKRNYAAALQDDAQLTLNEWLRTNKDLSFEAIAVGHSPQKSFTERVRNYPRYLERAAELLGSQHYMYTALKARRYFFDGYILANSNMNPDEEIGNQALRLFRKSLEWQADQPQVYWQISNVFGYNFLQIDSMEYYTKIAQDLYPNWTYPCVNTAFLLSFKFNQRDRAKYYLEYANRIDSNSVNVIQSWAVFLFGQNDFDAAQKLLLKAIDIDSTNATVWNNLGYCFLLISEYSKAIEALEKAISLDSTLIDAWGNLGSCYNETQRIQEAEEVFYKALAIDSNYAAIWSNLGYTYTQAGRFEKAEEVFLKAINLDSISATFWNNIANCYLNTSRYDLAVQALKKSIELDPNAAVTWYNLGYCYILNKHYTLALPALNTAVEIDSSSAVFWTAIGYTYLLTQRFDLALNTLNKAIHLDSTFANPYKHLGVVYFQINRIEEAKASLQKALALNPNFSAAMIGLAYVLHSEGQTNIAIQYVEEAISKGSRFEELANDENLAPLRSTPEYKQLMKKHFPDEFND